MTNIEEIELLLDTYSEMDKIDEIIDDVIEMHSFRTGGDNEKSYGLIMAMLFAIVDTTSLKFEVEPEVTRNRFVRIGAGVDEVIDGIEKGEP